MAVPKYDISEKVYALYYINAGVHTVVDYRWEHRRGWQYKLAGNTYWWDEKWLKSLREVEEILTKLANGGNISRI